MRLRSDKDFEKLTREELTDKLHDLGEYKPIFTEYSTTTVDSRYLEHALSRTFFPVLSTFMVYFSTKCLAIWNSAISNYSLSRTNFLVPRKNYSRYLELFRKCSS